MPFREAHHVTGRAVALAEARNCGLEDLSLGELLTVSDRIDGRVFEVLSVEKSVASRRSFGGTAPENVMKQVKYWRQRLSQ
jgi:argininosuccinate lyase